MGCEISSLLPYCGRSSPQRRMEPQNRLNAPLIQTPPLPTSPPSYGAVNTSNPLTTSSPQQEQQSISQNKEAFIKLFKTSEGANLCEQQEISSEIIRHFLLQPKESQEEAIKYIENFLKSSPDAQKFLSQNSNLSKLLKLADKEGHNEFCSTLGFIFDNDRLASLSQEKKEKLIEAIQGFLDNISTHNIASLTPHEAMLDIIFLKANLQESPNLPQIMAPINQQKPIFFQLFKAVAQDFSLNGQVVDFISNPTGEKFISTGNNFPHLLKMMAKYEISYRGGEYNSFFMPLFGSMKTFHHSQNKSTSTHYDLIQYIFDNVEKHKLDGNRVKLTLDYAMTLLPNPLEQKEKLEKWFGKSADDMLKDMVKICQSFVQQLNNRTPLEQVPPFPIITKYIDLGSGGNVASNASLITMVGAGLMAHSGNIFTFVDKDVAARMKDPNLLPPPLIISFAELTQNASAEELKNKHGRSYSLPRIGIKLKIAKEGEGNGLQREARHTQALSPINTLSIMPRNMQTVYITGFPESEIDDFKRNSSKLPKKHQFKIAERTAEGHIEGLISTEPDGYFSYLTDTSLSQEDLHKGVRKFVDTYMKYAQSGYFLTNLAPLFHNHNDMRSYCWMTTLFKALTPDHKITLHSYKELHENSAGRLDSPPEAFSFSNIKGSGAGDLKDVHTLEQMHKKGGALALQQKSSSTDAPTTEEINVYKRLKDNKLKHTYDQIFCLGNMLFCAMMVVGVNWIEREKLIEKGQKIEQIDLKELFSTICTTYRERINLYPDKTNEEYLEKFGLNLEDIANQFKVLSGKQQKDIFEGHPSYMHEQILALFSNSTCFTPQIDSTTRVSDAHNWEKGKGFINDDNGSWNGPLMTQGIINLTYAMTAVQPSIAR